MRKLGVKLKLTVVRQVVDGKRVVVVDDSIVRGTTTKGKIQSLRQAGASQVHMRISCPPLVSPCFYGIDFPTKEELLASNRSLDEIKEFLNVDSMGYISLEGLLSCLSLPMDHYCTACWTGKYRIPITMVVNKFSMERHQIQLFDDVGPYNV